MPKVVDREKMQHSILEAAMRAFGAKGFHAATIADVAEAAGLGKGTLYLYFKNKEAIAEAMVDSHFATLEAGFIAQTQPGTLDDLLAGLSRSMEVPEAHARFIRVFFEIFGPSFASDAFSRRIAAVFDRLGAHYADVLTHLQGRGEVRRDLDAQAAGRVLASLVDGMILHRGLFNISAARHAILRAEAVTLFCRGLAA